jgi:ubiquinone/menaquinone biosynthesis C-methylase UbiE
MSMDNDLKIINEHQKQNYERFEERTSLTLIEEYSCVLEKMKNRDTLKILDVGGGSGNFALALRKYFSNKKCEVFVLDSAKYDTWAKYANEITFIEGSASELRKFFDTSTFDLIFANRVFHHFVGDSWKRSINGMLDITKQIGSLVKKDGYFCIIDYFYNGQLCDKAASKTIYTLTTSTFPPIVALNKKLGSKSAGVGVCFLSKKMWLNMFSQTGFIIEILNEKSAYKMNKLKKLCLFIESCKEDNVIILRKLE